MNSSNQYLSVAMVITLFLLRTRRADFHSCGKGGWTSRGWGRCITNSLIMGRLGGFVMEKVEGLVEGGGGGGHGHHPLLYRTSRASPWPSPYPALD